MPDLALGLQDSLDRFGRGGMEVPFRVPDGSGVAPGYAFVNEPSLGFYRAGTGQLGVAVGGAGRLFLSSTLWDSIVPMRLNAQNAGTQLTVKQGSAQTEAILKVISNDELTEYLAIDNAGQVTIDNQTISSILPTLKFEDTDALLDEKKYRFRNNGGQFQAQLVSDDELSVRNFMAVDRTGTDIDAINMGGELQVLGVNVATTETNWLLADITDVTSTAAELNLLDGKTSVATLEANTFTGNQIISSGTLGLGVNDVTPGLLNVYGSLTGVEGGEIRIYTAADYDAVYDYFAIDAFEDKFRIIGGGQLHLQIDPTAGTINAPSANFQQGGINVATVNTNWLLSDITDVTATATEVNYTDGVTSAIQPQLNSKAPLASPALTGTPTAPTAAAGTNTTQLATTAFVQGKKSIFVTNADGSPTSSVTQFDIDASITEGTWESVGPTGSGATNIWTGLDNVPSNIDWVEIKIYQSGFDGTANTDIDGDVLARKNGSSQGVGIDTVISTMSARADSSGQCKNTNSCIAKIPVNNRVFDLRYTSGFTAYNAAAMLTGYGYN